MKLYFARHGESEANVRGIYANRPGDEFSLTRKGIAQAKQLAAALSETPLSKIYSSPLLRAIQTAHILSETLGLKPEIAPALREYDTGILEGQSTTDPFNAIYAENERAWFVDRNFDHRIPGGESLREIEERFVPFIYCLRRQFRDQSANVLLIGHGGLFRAMFPRILRNASFDTLYQWHMPHCEFVVVEPDGTDLLCSNWPQPAM